MQRFPELRRRACATLAVFLVLVAAPVAAAELRVAVASNFVATMSALAGRFETTRGHTLKLSSGSTGKHFAQISNGAPFDVFFAADAERPRLLEERSHAIAGSRYSYALGRLVLWSPDADLVDPDARVLESRVFRHLAISNPRLAPYGRAAEEVLRGLGAWNAIGSRLVRGENVAQTLQFVASGNAALGFVAYSQVRRPGHSMPGSIWVVPTRLYTPIDQQAVVIRDSAAARELMQFMRTAVAQAIIRDHGYATP